MDAFFREQVLGHAQNPAKLQTSGRLVLPFVLELARLGMLHHYLLNVLAELPYYRLPESVDLDNLSVDVAKPAVCSALVP